MYDNIQANILPLTTPSTPEWGQKVKTVIKYNGNETDDNMKANILPIHTPFTRGVQGSKHCFLLILVMLHSK